MEKLNRILNVIIFTIVWIGIPAFFHLVLNVEKAVYLSMIVTWIPAALVVVYIEND